MKNPQIGLTSEEKAMNCASTEVNVGMVPIEQKGIKLPSKLKIGGHWYKVLFPYHFKERSDCCGQHLWNPKELRLTDIDENGIERADSAIYVSLIHEILHALSHLTESNYFTEKEGEKFVESLSEMVYQFLVDNGFLKQGD